MFFPHVCDSSYLTESAAETSNQVDPFGRSLIGDLMDAPISMPTETSAMNGNSSEADLFADANFVSAPTQVEKEASSQPQVRFIFILISRNEVTYVNLALMCHL